MTLNEAKQALAALQRRIAAYDHAQSLIYYDGCTTAPKGTAANRGVALSVLSEESYKFCTGNDGVFDTAFEGIICINKENCVLRIDFCVFAEGFKL